MTQRERWLLCVLFGLGLVVSAPQQAAAQTGEGKKAAAQALFDEGQALKKEQQFEQACEKFAASQKLDPAIGTQLNLADCYERIGRTASAWIHYKEVVSRARRSGSKARQKIAQERVTALDPQLTRMLVEVDDPAEGIVIERNGAVIPQEMWGAAVPVDPAGYEVRATAPGRQAWSTTVEVDEEGATVTVEVPALEDAPADPGEPGGPEPADEPADDGSAQTTAGIVVGALGLVGVGVGIAFAAVAHSTYDDSLAHCPTDETQCTAEGVELREDAQSAQTVYVASFAVGGAAVITGLVLLLTAPSGEPGGEGGADTAGVWVLPSLGSQGGGLHVGARW